MKNKKTYETTIRGKWIYGESSSFNEMIEQLLEQAKFLAELRDAGCELNAEGAADDYFFVTTKDKKVAGKFGMEEVEKE
jgi:hypothetical protein